MRRFQVFSATATTENVGIEHFSEKKKLTKKVPLGSFLLDKKKRLNPLNAHFAET